MNIREIGRIDPKDLERDASATRCYSEFLVELASRIPEHMLPNISLLLCHLDKEVGFLMLLYLDATTYFTIIHEIDSSSHYINELYIKSIFLCNYNDRQLLSLGNAIVMAVSDLIMYGVQA